MKIRKIQIILASFVVLLLCGCEKNKKDTNDNLNTDIKSIVVNYEKEGTNRKVKVDFSKKERTTTIYSKETEKLVEKYDDVNDLEQFIRGKVLSDERLIVKNTSKEKSDEQKILWSIRVNFEDEGWAIVESLSGNPYLPEYWDELMMLIEK